MLILIRADLFVTQTDGHAHGLTRAAPWMKQARRDTETDEQPAAGVSLGQQRERNSGWALHNTTAAGGVPL
ncbi:hypothetical protein VZT92_002212 [Zoarces viviparus]|uniref:Uncharacterized protein n=1 Tax=Zoarces viviparus TaxID=48416 RepID=A0AAW1FZI3_ZOAVI